MLMRRTLQKVSTVVCFMMVITALGAQEAEVPKQTAQKERCSIGLSAEVNMNSPEKAGMGSGLYALFLLPDGVKTGRFQLGVKALYTYGFYKYHMLGSMLLVRWNYDFNRPQTTDSGLFVQAEVGFNLGWNGQKDAAKPFAYGLGNIVIGYRHPFNRFFIEPYVYTGYPALFGGGLSIGVRL